jgi:hypothetical protein
VEDNFYSDELSTVKISYDDDNFVYDEERLASIVITRPKRFSKCVDYDLLNTEHEMKYAEEHLKTRTVIRTLVHVRDQDAYTIQKV